VAAEELGGRVGDQIGAPLEGRHRNGVASVLSTISGMPTECAISAIAAMSTTTPPGFARLSTRSLCTSASARGRKFSGSSGSTENGSASQAFGNSSRIASGSRHTMRETPGLVAGSSIVANTRNCAHGRRRARRRRGRPSSDAMRSSQHRNGRIGQARIDVAKVCRLNNDAA